ncbi:hypothetical protein ACLKA7_012485 [Drosophila subpalustris]
MDETWIHHYIPESNRSSVEWREAGESRSKRVKASRWVVFMQHHLLHLTLVGESGYLFLPPEVSHFVVHMIIYQWLLCWTCCSSFSPQRSGTYQKYIRRGPICVDIFSSC